MPALPTVITARNGLAAASSLVSGPGMDGAGIMVGTVTDIMATPITGMVDTMAGTGVMDIMLVVITAVMAEMVAIEPDTVAADTAVVMADMQVAAGMEAVP